MAETNSQHLGDSTNALCWNLDTCDITFMNRFKLTEDGDDAIAVINPQGVKVAAIDKEGNLLIKW